LSRTVLIIFTINCERFNATCLSRKTILWRVVTWLRPPRRRMGRDDEDDPGNAAHLCRVHQGTAGTVNVYSVVLPSVVDPDLELFGQVGSVSVIILPDPDLTPFTRIIQCCGSGMFILDTNFVRPGSRIQGLKDSGSASNKLSNFNQKNCF
jgi:hypothetical protein